MATQAFSDGTKENDSHHITRAFASGSEVMESGIHKIAKLNAPHNHRTSRKSKIVLLGHSALSAHKLFLLRGLTLSYCSHYSLRTPVTNPSLLLYIMSGLTSTTAPGKTFSSRGELADHYKSDWHKYNLKRREAGLPLLREADFEARLEAALALKKEREGREQRTGTDHLKKKREKKNQQVDSPKEPAGVTIKSQAPAYDRIKKKGEEEAIDQSEADEMVVEESTDETQKEEEEAPVIEPRQCLFDKHMSPSVEANLERMQRKYGFFLPDQEYLVDTEGLIGYCHEKIKLGHYCLYCQRIFRSWQGCQKHMIATRHTKLKYEQGIDMEEFDPFYDFSEANEDFLGTKMGSVNVTDEEEGVMDEDGDDAGWEDVTDDEDEEMGEGGEDDDMKDEEGEGLYSGYEEEIAKYGFDVTPLGELVFPDGRIVGHRGLARYYKQRVNPNQDRAAVVAARRAAGDRVYNGRVYNVAKQPQSGHTNALALARACAATGVAPSGEGQGILVPSRGGGFTAVSLYRYRAVVKKAHRDEARGQRLQNRTKQNINRMDKKANRLMNGVSVAHASR